MPKQPKPFIVEFKSSRRKRTKPLEQPKSIWGNLAIELQQNLAEEQETSIGSPASQQDATAPDLPAATVAICDEDAAAAPSTSRFIRKWSEKMAERPSAKGTDAVAAFLVRIERQKALLVEFHADPAGFDSWRSAWFRKVAGGFGVNIGHDSVDAGAGLRYVVVESIQDVTEFLDDLAHHAQTDTNFQRALEETRRRRAARRVRTRQR